MAEEWVVSFRELEGAEVKVASTSKEAALVQARDLVRQRYTVESIEGPDEALDKEAIERWVEAHPE